MGQKVNPNGLRLGISRGWDSVWYSERNYAENVLEDHKIRTYLRKNYGSAFISHVEIVRFSDQVRVTIHAARPGSIIGKKGAEIEIITKELQKLVKEGRRVSVSVKEIKVPELDASVVGQDIARQIERRTSYKRAIKQAIRNAMKSGAKGIKVRISGRLNGAEIARTEEFKEGRLPLSTLKADIDYCVSEAYTEMGAIGIKVWIYRDSRDTVEKRRR
ncbi:30S ribosomal protein S3 [Thermospira aquatica]|uniref:Small ribosomal subunit protein uS3 n=1 Tax=Thermospira aquatica TaxID=2828656 RepID=A0AAX3BG91_9SPIR|nr:30S ribosomal protein S3 [Thermospira aquatica]URA11329.1 30S ribosomal protein S3 [Thermospira aquatica]